MALDESALFEGLEVLEVSDRIRQAAETMYQALFEAELTVVIGAAPYERNQVRTALRKRSSAAHVDHAGGNLELRILKLYVGSFFPSPLASGFRPS